MSSGFNDRDRQFGAFVRARLGDLTVSDVANGIGKSPVTVYKIMSGERRYNGSLEDLSAVLGLTDDDRRELERLHRSRAPIADTVRQRRSNARARNALTERTDQLMSEDALRRELLRRTQSQVQLQFLDPFLRFIATVDGLTEGLAELDLRIDPDLPLAAALASQQALFVDAMGRMSEDAAAKAAGIAAGTTAAGAALGGTAAFALFTGVAAVGTASTGAAIAGLSGAAATSATLAAIGGGSLAAGGLGVAGGTAVLAGLVATPVLIGLAAGALLADRYMYRHEIQVAESLDDLEQTLTAARAEGEIRWEWARKQGYILDTVLQRTKMPMLNIGNVRLHPETGRIGWQELTMWHEDIETLVHTLTIAVVAMSLPTWSNEVDFDNPDDVAEVTRTYEDLSAAATATSA